MNYRTSKAAREAFGAQMREIEAYCRKNDIHQSLKSDSYYFKVAGQAYRVSNHSVEISDRGMWNEHVDRIEHAGQPIGGVSLRIAIQIANALGISDLRELI
jgi:hypothetical protein